MADVTFTELYGLNINTSPHPAGIYPRLLKETSKNLVQARGSDYAKITEPVRSEDNAGFYIGRVLVWTNVDVKGRWLDLSKEDDLSDSLKRSISIPENAKPNFGHSITF